ncbi:MAG: hypothetical protein JXR37_23490 [Kiritimatiellae bacterium]|nr:hypothetical protein [Kiritimatiellia bacterium]
MNGSREARLAGGLPAGAVLLGGLIMIAVTALALAGPTGAETPADPAGLGYIVVTAAPYNADPTGAADATAAIQKAIEDAYEQGRAVLVPSGAYTISDTLRLYEWRNWARGQERPSTPGRGRHNLFGSRSGGLRPVVKLRAGAAGFGDPSLPRPMIAYRKFKALNKDAVRYAVPVNPLGSPANFASSEAATFGNVLHGIDFDCNGNAGAIGVTCPGAQSCTLMDVKVIATGAYAGFYRMPGADSISGNIEVQGGRYGVIVGVNEIPGSATGGGDGSTIVGARLLDQTHAAYWTGDFGVGRLVGFHVRKGTAGSWLKQSGGSSAKGSAVLLDGVVEVRGVAAGSVALANAAGKNLYVRNVFVAGTDKLIRSGEFLPCTGTGAWKRIAEYAFNDQTNVDGNSDPTVFPSYRAGSRFESRTLIDGVLGAAAEPIPAAKAVVNDAPAPASTDEMVNRHVVPNLPMFSDGPFINVAAGGYRATPDDGTDDRAQIQRAIDDARAAGHNRVVIPKGVFHIGSPGLMLHKDTRLMGAGQSVTTLRWHDGWLPTTQVYLVNTADDAAATTFLGYLTLLAPTTPNIPLAHDFVGHYHWRAGRHSMTAALDLNLMMRTSKVKGQPTTFVEFSGAGGGRHFKLCNPYNTAMSGNYHADSRVLVVKGTTEPLWLYGVNMEFSKRGSPYMATNIEIVNARNVRIIGPKREGVSPTAIITDSANVAILASGGMRGPVRVGGGYLEITGTSHGILAACFNTQTAGRGGPPAPNGPAMIREAMAGRRPVAIPWPTMVSLYKRGELDDEAMSIGRASD